ncbi:MAG TPA: hypothetical protein VE338_07530 [Ktedonobacterales bacterium]|nr:hypothetical protein [Ktedonobacterales bacterium]
MTSSSQWRIPDMRVEQPRVRVAQARGPQRWRDAAQASATHSLTVVRAALRTIIAGLLIGGVLVAPALAVVAVVALFAPIPAAVRHLAPALIVASLIWLTVAIFGAHTQVERCTEPPVRSHEAE